MNCNLVIRLISIQHSKLYSGQADFVVSTLGNFMSRMFSKMWKFFLVFITLSVTFRRSFAISAAEVRDMFRSRAGWTSKDYTERCGSIMIDIVNSDEVVDMDFVKKFHHNICKEIESFSEKRGFFTSANLDAACACMCGDIITYDQCTARFSSGTAGHDLGENIMKWAVNKDDVLIEDDIIDTWFEMFWRIWPLLIGLIPVFMNAYSKDIDWRVYMLLAFISLISFMFLDISRCQQLYIFLTFVCTGISTGPYGVTPEIVGGSAGIIFFICISFIYDIMYQIICAMFLIVMYLAYLYTTFYQRRHGTMPGFIVFLVNLFVMCEQAHILRTTYKSYTLGMYAFDLLSKTVVPYGPNRSYTRNLLFSSTMLTKRITDMFPSLADKAVPIFIVCTTIAVLFVFALRSLFGTFVILSMRYKNNVSNLGNGFLVYVTDIYSGPFYLLGCLFGFHPCESRRFMYSVVNTIMIIFEACYGIEWFACRIIAWIWDSVANNGRFQKTTKYLSSDMNKSDFPQHGAIPWMSFDKVSELMKAVNLVKIKSKEKNERPTWGLGLVIRASGRNLLVSVNHVIRNAEMLTIGHQSIVHPETSLKIGVNDALIGVEVDNDHFGADLKILNRAEARGVVALLVIKKDEFKKPYQTYVNRFKFERDNTIKASVNLDYGNSGGPVFALMDDDEIRLAGVISAGDDDRNAGNFISSVIADHDGLNSAGDIWRDRFDPLSDDNDSSSESSRVKGILKKVVFKNQAYSDEAEKLKNIIDKVHVLSQSFCDKYKCFWFIDESDDGNEIKWIPGEMPVDIIDQINNIRQGKKRYPKRRNNTSLTSVEFEEQASNAISELSKIHYLLKSVSGQKIARRYMSHLRLGLRPRIECKDNELSFENVSGYKPDKVTKEFEYYTYQTN